MLAERGIDTAGCVEKVDLAQRVVDKCATVTYYK